MKQTKIEMAKKLKKNGVRLYFKYGCGACAKQFQMFGKNATLELDKIDCEGGNCDSNTIPAVPLWFQPSSGKSIVGAVTPSKLVKFFSNDSSGFGTAFPSGIPTPYNGHTMQNTQCFNKAKKQMTKMEKDYITTGQISAGNKGPLLEWKAPRQNNTIPSPTNVNSKTAGITPVNGFGTRKRKNKKSKQVLVGFYTNRKGKQIKIYSLQKLSLSESKFYVKNGKRIYLKKNSKTSKFGQCSKSPLYPNAAPSGARGGVPKTMYRAGGGPVQNKLNITNATLGTFGPETASVETPMIRPYGPTDMNNLLSGFRQLPGVKAGFTFGNPTPGTKGWKQERSILKKGKTNSLNLGPKCSKTAVNIATEFNFPMAYKGVAFGQAGKRPNMTPSSIHIQGPNKVAYEEPFNMYMGAGGNTLNQETGSNYLPPYNAPDSKIVTDKTAGGYFANTDGFVSNAFTQKIGDHSPPEGYSWAHAGAINPGKQFSNSFGSKASSIVRLYSSSPMGKIYQATQENLTGQQRPPWLSEEQYAKKNLFGRRKGGQGAKNEDVEEQVLRGKGRRAGRKGSRNGKKIGPGSILKISQGKIKVS